MPPITQTGLGEATGMDSALLKNLVTGAGSSSQFIGGLVVALLYVVIGVLGAIGSILVFRRVFQRTMGTYSGPRSF